MGGLYLLGQDNAIIATAFAQLALEGCIDSGLKTITITAIKRQLLPILINRYDAVCRATRTDRLEKMLEVVRKAVSKQ